MIREIVHDTFFLQQPSEPAVRSDVKIGKDLQDTLRANQEHCVGMAANMIGVRKRIIIIAIGKSSLVMFNPELIRKEGVYETEEGCLSLEGKRHATRYETIEVRYLDERWRKQTIKLHGWPAQICQHELDHLEGILI